MPAGVEVILRVLASGGLHADGVRLLDAGCGTGSYLVALCDSIWALVTDAELQAVLAALRALHDAGTVSAYVQEHDQARQRIGQAVFVQAWRR